MNIPGHRSGLGKICITLTRHICAMNMLLINIVNYLFSNYISYVLFCGDDLPLVSRQNLFYMKTNY